MFASFVNEFPSFFHCLSMSRPPGARPRLARCLVKFRINNFTIGIIVAGLHSCSPCCSCGACRLSMPLLVIARPLPQKRRWYAHCPFAIAVGLRANTCRRSPAGHAARAAACGFAAMVTGCWSAFVLQNGRLQKSRHQCHHYQCGVQQKVNNHQVTFHHDVRALAASFPSITTTPASMAPSINTIASLYLGFGRLVVRQLHVTGTIIITN